MNEITFKILRDDESGWLVASWDSPDACGGITTQAKDLKGLQEQVVDAVAVHFDEAETPSRIRFHFVNDAILLTA